MISRLVGLVLFASFCLVGAGVATSATIDFNGPDIARLLRAVDSIDASPDIQLHISIKSASEMPTYDPLAYYVGLVPSGNPHEAALWMLGGADPKGVELQRALRAALELSAMDTGLAGPKWKQIYDDTAAADARLAPSEADRYLNRHAVTAAVQAIYDKTKSSLTSPSPSP